jgi:hypothetical protein
MPRLGPPIPVVERRDALPEHQKVGAVPAVSREQLAAFPDRIALGIIGRNIMATARSLS